MEHEKNSAVSTPEMVTISRAEYDSQQAQLTELKLQNQWLLEQLGLAKKRQFGASSERLQEGLMDQLSFMANEAEAYAYGTQNATAEQVAVKAKGLIEAIRKGSPSTRLYVQSLLPIDESDGRWKLLAGKSATIAEVNSMIEEHCRVNGISFINLYPRFVRRGTATLRRELSRDGLHLSPQGYKLWAFELGRYVGSLK